MSVQMRTHLFPAGLKFAAALLMVMGLFLLGVVLTPPAPAPKLVYNQVVFVQPVAAQVPQPNASAAVDGTLASFTALIPESLALFIPSVAR